MLFLKVLKYRWRRDILKFKTLFSFSLFILILSISCSGKRPCGKACNSVLQKPSEEMFIDGDEVGETLLELFQEIVRSKMPSPEESGILKELIKPINVLSLSAGGQYGAFGAGFIVGWCQTDMPKFDVVTSVSTGSLLAPFIFLLSGHIDNENNQKVGSKNKNEDEENKVCNRDGIKGDIIKLLAGIYGDGIENSEVVEGSLLINLIKKKALFSREPLRRLLKDSLSEAYINEIARQKEKGRALLVGAVNADTGKFKMIDLTAVAAESKYSLEERQRIFIDTIMASSAVPVIFPVEFINGEMYIDGGAREYVFFYQIQEKFDEALKLELKKNYSSYLDSPPQRTNTFYMIVHGDYVVNEECTSYDPKSIAIRSMGIVLDQILRVSVFYNAYLAINSDKDRETRCNKNRDNQDRDDQKEEDQIKLDPWNIKVLSARDHSCKKSPCEKDGKKNNPELFDPIFTKCLYEFGDEKAKDPKWITSIDDLGKFIEESKEEPFVPDPPYEYGTCKP